MSDVQTRSVLERGEGERRTLPRGSFDWSSRLEGVGGQPVVGVLLKQGCSCSQLDHNVPPATWSVSSFTFSFNKVMLCKLLPWLHRVLIRPQRCLHRVDERTRTKNSFFFFFATAHDFISLSYSVRDGVVKGGIVCRCDCISSVLAQPGTLCIELSFFHLRLVNVIWATGSA